MGDGCWEHRGAAAGNSRVIMQSSRQRAGARASPGGEQQASRRAQETECAAAAGQRRWHGASRGRMAAANALEGLHPVPGCARGLALLMLAVAVVRTTDAITFPCIAPLLGPTIPSAPSREPSPARGGADNGQQNLRLTIRGGDLAASKTPRARSDSGTSDTGSDDSSLVYVSDKLKALSVPMRPGISTGAKIMVRFRINYSTRWGENVILVGSTEELGGVQEPTEGEVRKCIAGGKGKVMRYIADGNWEFATMMPSAPTEVVYRYALVRERGDPLVEGGIRSGRVLDLEECVRRSRTVRRGVHSVGSAGSSASLKDAASRDGPLQVEVRDQWRVSRANGEDVVLRSAAISSVIYGAGRADALENALCNGVVKHAAELLKKVPPVKGAELGNSGTAVAPGGAGGGGGGDGGRNRPVPFRLTVERTRVPHGCGMAVVCDALFSGPAVMTCERFPEWELEVSPSLALLPAAYQYVVVNLTTGEVVGREEGAQRTLHPPERSVQQNEAQVSCTYVFAYAPACVHVCVAMHAQAGDTSS